MWIFQPTRPVRGGTTAAWRIPPQTPKFQPTRPVRGGTDADGVWSTGECDFNPPAP